MSSMMTAFSDGHKCLGLVSEVFTSSVMKQFPTGKMAVAHARYGTTGGSNLANCQPIEVNHLKGKLALAHNGNLSNALQLRRELELSGAIFHTTSDTETIAYVITRERITAPSIQAAVSRAVDRLEGAFSLVMMSSTKLIAVRDPHGFRPLCYGKMKDGTYIVASESCALHAVGAEFQRDILPGEILTFDCDGIHSDTSHCGTAPKKMCIFEYIYFARPDSVIDGVSVHDARVRAGEILAKTHPVDADIVIGVPDSGLDAAMGYARESGIPYGIGLIKNKYIGRTFIAPGQDHRVDQVKIKLSPVESEVRGKRVVMVDDSIVRGTTSGAHRAASAGSGSEGNSHAHLRAAVSAPLLLWHGHRLPGPSDCLPRIPWPKSGRSSVWTVWAICLWGICVTSAAAKNIAAPASTATIPTAIPDGHPERPVLSRSFPRGKAR